MRDNGFCSKLTAAVLRATIATQVPAWVGQLLSPEQIAS